MNKRLPYILLTSLLLLTGCDKNDITTSGNDLSNNSSISNSGDSSTTITSTSSSGSSSSSSSSLQSSSSSSTIDGEKDAYTILLYMCGSDLESSSDQGGLATANLKEILSVNLPDNVNFVIETGGAKLWKTTYGISSSKLGRYEVKNKKLVLKESLSKTNMGSSSTLQSFIEWGLNNYPSEKTGFIFWNHGGAMQGVCCDENYNNDSLLNSEVKSAFSKAFANTNIATKLEWVGYDACLMAVQDIAEFNSNYFNYMIASQESEPGEGWDYDVWLSTLAKNVNISTEDLLKNVSDSYIKKCADLYKSSGYGSSYNDATMSVLNLNKMTNYHSQFESLAKNLSKSFTKSTFKSFFNNCNQFGYSYDDDGYSGEFCFDVVDVGDFLNTVDSKFSNIDVSSTVSALNELVVYNVYGKDKYEGGTRDKLSGLCLFAATTGYSSKTEYSTSETSFTNWRAINVSYGTWHSY